MTPKKTRDELEKQVEQCMEAHRQCEDRLNEAQRLSRIGSWERDLTTNEGWWSAESFRLFGLNPEESAVAYQTFLERVHPDDRPRVIESTRTAVQERGRYDLEYRIVGLDSEIRNVHAQAEVVLNEEGQPVRLIGTIQDITVRVALEREIVTAGEYERNRIGRELHDGLGQELTGVSLRLQSLSRKLTQERSPHIRELQDLTTTVQSTIAETRRIARDLAPGFSTELGLCTALRALIEEVNEYSELTCHAHCSYEKDIHDTEIATHFYRIAQESISNALRHSGAQNIELRYGRDGDSLFLEVLDDGVGILSKPERIEGVGLKSMRYRARMLHGRLEIGLRSSGGTRILCSCPFQPD